jgi:hypothetical protein
VILHFDVLFKDFLLVHQQIIVLIVVDAFILLRFESYLLLQIILFSICCIIMFCVGLYLIYEASDFGLK